MLSIDRPEFDAQLKVLFGGWPGTLLTQERNDAYWRGLQKMQLSMFVRCIDFVLGDNGIVKLPTVNELWTISRNFRASVSPPVGAHRDMGEYLRRLESLVEMRRHMPKDRFGHIMHPDYAPPHRRAELRSKWDKYFADHPGEFTKYVREHGLLMTGHAPDFAEEQFA